jgi:hypothetical protein
MLKIGWILSCQIKKTKFKKFTFLLLHALSNNSYPSVMKFGLKVLIEGFHKKYVKAVDLALVCPLIQQIWIKKKILAIVQLGQSLTLKLACTPPPPTTTHHHHPPQTF